MGDPKAPLRVLRVDGKKQACRRELQILWEGLSPQEGRRLGAELDQALCAAPLWGRTTQVLAYLSFGREIPLEALMERTLQEGKELYLPRVGGRDMTFHRVWSLTTRGFHQNKWGIWEPPASAPGFIPQGEPLILVPGLGFTLRGERMGRGGGFYDRFIRSLAGTAFQTLGVCWEGVLCGELPLEEHDQTLHWLSRGKELWDCSKAEAGPAPSRPL